MIDLPAIALAIFIALFWFVSMYLIHGAVYLDSFLEDQVGMRISTNAIQEAVNLALAVILMIILFVPWYLFGFKDIKTNWINIKKENIAFTGFVIVWVLSIIMMTGMVSKFSERYLLPVIPFGSIWLAWWLAKAGIFNQNRGKKIASMVFLIINVISIAAALFLNVGLGAPWLVFGGLGLGILACSYLFYLWWNYKKILRIITYSILLLFYLGSFVTYQISLPDQGIQAKSFASQRKIPQGSRIAFVGPLHTGSKIRIGLGKNYRMVVLPQDGHGDEISGFRYIIVEDRHLDKFDDQKYHIQVLTLNWDPKIIREMGGSIFQKNVRVTLEKHEKKYYWLTKK